jgi:hypothetical protein
MFNNNNNNNNNNNCIHGVVAHEHIDCYKRADSSSDLIGVFDDLTDARRVCIKHMFRYNDVGLNMFSPTLFGILQMDSETSEEKKVDFEDEEEDEEEDVDNDIIDIMDRLNSSTVDTVYTEMLRFLSEQEATYTMKATQYTCQVYSKEVNRSSYFKKMTF